MQQQTMMNANYIAGSAQPGADALYIGDLQWVRRLLASRFKHYILNIVLYSVDYG